MIPLSCIGKGDVIYCLESDRVVDARFPGVRRYFGAKPNNSLKREGKKIRSAVDRSSFHRDTFTGNERENLSDESFIIFLSLHAREIFFFFF